MTAVAVTGISELVTNDPGNGDGSPLGIVHGAAVVVEDGRIVWVGAAAARPPTGATTWPDGPSSRGSWTPTPTSSSPATGRPSSRPGWPGVAYDGGGIATTVAATRAAGDELCGPSWPDGWPRCGPRARPPSRSRAATASPWRTRLRLLRLAGEVTAETTYPRGPRRPGRAPSRDDYLELVTGEMLAACAPHARWIDVFCEPASPHAFDGDEARAVLAAGRQAGLGLRVHGNQLSAGPGVRLAVELGAASVDHCTLPRPTPTSTPWPAGTPWPPCCRGWSSPPGRLIRTPAGCSTPA